MADILGAQAGAPGPVYEGGPNANVTPADVMAGIAKLPFPLRLLAPAIGGAMLPGDVASGKVPADLSNPEYTGRAADLASLMIGAPGGTGGLGSGARDPNLWHGISQVKLPKPISEMSASIEPLPVGETRVTPAQLQGGQLLPAIGDRSAASGTLTGFNGFEFANPVELQGGHGYMPANTERGVVWAGKQGPISTIQKRAEMLAQSGDPVLFPYTAMGERAVDFSHMPSEAVIEALPSAKIARSGRTAFNEAMRGESKDFGPLEDWPGIGSQNLREYLAGAPGYARNKFVKAMDTREMQEAGFPSVAEARYAVTDPRLLDVPTGASGLSISRLDPGRSAAESAHRTYETALPGQYVGGFGTSVPRELMYPDIVKALEEYRANMPAGKMTPTIEYLMSRTPKGLPIAQPANQQWVDTVSNFLRTKGLLPAAGLTAGAAATMSDEAKAEPSAADVVGAQTGSPGPVYEGGPTGKVTPADVLGALGMGGPSWIDRAQQQTAADIGAYQRGGVPGLLADTGQTAELAGGFGGTTTPAKGIRAYHGSPYDFEKFDLSKIGTGEGAQAYGHGLYFAENPQTAQSYRDSLSDLKNRAIKGTDLTVPSWVAKGMESSPARAQELLTDFRGRVAQNAEEMKTAHDPWNYQSRAEGLQNIVKAIEAHIGGAEIAPAGRMYEVNINAKPEQFLDWDKPLGQQPQAVQQLFGEISQRPNVKVLQNYLKQSGQDLPGSSAYKAIASDQPSGITSGIPQDMRTSQMLNEAGIPGIRYLDQGSRGARPNNPIPGGYYDTHPGTSNYVVFNPDIVDILKKYGLAGLTMGGVLQAQSQSPPQ